MSKQWLYVLKEYGEEYGVERIVLDVGYLYFVVEGCVIVRSNVDCHVMFVVRKRACINMEAMTNEQFEYEYCQVGKVRLLKIHRNHMNALLFQYPKLMQRMLRQEQHVLDQMILFSKLYQGGCLEKNIKQVYRQLHISFSYKEFRSFIINDGSG